MTSSNLAGKSAIVTGAGSGMGRAITQALAAEGVRVAALGIEEDPIKETAAMASGAIAIQVDISDAEQVKTAFQAAIAELGSLDIVINAAGIDDVETKKVVHEQVAAGKPVNVIPGITDKQWRLVNAVNLDGSFFVLRAAAEAMVPGGAGSIVLIGSESAVHGLTGLAHYSASKGGVHALVRSAAIELIVHGVRLNGISPGVIDTPMSRRSGEIFGDKSGRPVAPIGRKGRVEEIANAAVFLASDLASYIVGEVLNVDGGRTAS